MITETFQRKILMKKKASRRSRILVTANWKMAFLPNEAEALTREIAAIQVSDQLDVVLCPSFTALEGVAKTLAGTRILLGAQDVFWQARGAYTGEVSAEELRAVGCSYVIIGHSERRREYNENDQMINRKVLAGLAYGLSVILCVGESSDERRQNIHHARVSRQVHEALRNVPPPRYGQELVIAYEPIWAIGSGYPAERDQVITMAGVIQQALVDVFGVQISQEATRIIYGGSVVPENVKGFVDQENIQGVLLGKASQYASSFSTILGKFSSARI